MNNFKVITAKKLADYILAMYGPMSHLKLQKLLYYVQGWHLGAFGEPIISEDFYAWLHGPVEKGVWEKYKRISVLHTDIPKPSNYLELKKKMKASLHPEQNELIMDVLKVYGEMTAYRLEALTHSEKPWIQARRGVPNDAPSDNIISQDSIKKFFEHLIEVK